MGDTMDLLHSAALLLSMVLAGAGLAAAVACLRMRAAAKRRGRPPPSPAATRLPALLRGSAAAIAAAALCLCSSVLVHRYCGHGPDSPEPMGIPRFLAEHPAFAVAALLVFSGAAALAFARNRA